MTDSQRFPVVCDTQKHFFDLLTIYSKRPSKIEWMNFGHWLNEACGLQDRKLAASMTTSEAKKVCNYRQHWGRITLKQVHEFNKENA
jgi:hypothetical protein